MRDRFEIACQAFSASSRAFASSQIERVEAFGEPAVHRSEKIAGFNPLIPFAPDARKADRCPQFE
jgi:hypothetical protein